MRILIDAYWLPHGPVSGKSVVQEIIANWIEVFPDDELVIASPRPSAMDVLPDQAYYVKTSLKVHPLINAIELPKIAARVNADWILAQNFAPLKLKSATFVHDYIFRSNPEWFSKKELAYLRMVPLLLPSTSVVLTSSKCEAERIATYSPGATRAKPVGLGVSTALQEAEPKRPDGRLEAGNFALVVGRINVRKNLNNLIEGALLDGTISSAYPLVVVGEVSGRTEVLSRSARTAIERREIIMTGYISNSELRWLYEHCDIMCFPSIDEGFGLPPVEASYFGAKLLVSDIPVMRENLGESAHYVDPHSVSSISEGLQMARATNGHGSRVGRNRHSWRHVVENIRTTLLEADDKC